MTYGFDRVKTLVAYTNGITIFAIALWIVYEAFQRLIEPSPVLGGPMLVVAIIGLCVNIAAFFVLHGGDRDSLNMRGAILHVLGDLLGSVAALVAALVIITTGWTLIDPILSVLVAVLLFRSAWSLMREAGHVLLEGVPESLDRDGIARDIEGHVAGVREVHHMHVWSMDGAQEHGDAACLPGRRHRRRRGGRRDQAAAGAKPWHRPCDGRAGIRPLRRCGRRTQSSLSI